MRRLIAFGGLFFCTCALTAPPAVASGVRTVSCHYDKALVPDNPGPVKQLRIRQAAQRVDNYLDRCQVATFVAGAATGSKTLHLHGARWFIGVFHCTYRTHQGARSVVTRVQCVHTGKYASTVWFESLG